jgi:hypothetical protein
MAVSYTTLEPTFTSSLSKPGSPLGFDTGTAVTLFSSTSFLWSAGIMISVVAAGFMYMRAGIIRMQASEAGVRKSNAEIKRVTLGLLGVLSLFVILYTFNKGLLRGDVGLEGLKANSVNTGSVTGAGTNPSTTAGTGSVPPPAATDGSEAANRKILGDAGISINHAACATAADRGCTNVGNINPASISMLLQLKSECGCALMVNGGSEPNGHSATSNHGPGKEAVDLENNLELLNLLKTKTAVGSGTLCNTKYGYAGFIFWYEPPGCDENTKTTHFHASFTGR